MGPRQLIWDPSFYAGKLSVAGNNQLSRTPHAGSEGSRLRRGQLANETFPTAFLR